MAAMADPKRAEIVFILCAKKGVNEKLYSSSYAAEPSGWAVLGQVVLNLGQGSFDNCAYKNRVLDMHSEIGKPLIGDSASQNCRLNLTGN